ncbi:MAG: S9 family peptidase [Eubacteriales bacterium]|nr:S9 family peptidase [Eubacteriales bacterium]
MKKIRLDHFTDFNFLSALEAAEDQSKAVFALSKANKEENKYESDLWQLVDGKATRLTADGKVSGFTWLDDESILFPAKRTKKEEESQGETHYYRLSLKGGEAQKAFTVPLAVQAIWPLENERYLLSVAVDQNCPDFYKLKAKDREAYFKEQKDFAFRHKMTRIPFYFNGRGFLDQESSALFLFSAKNSKVLPLTPLDLDVEAVYVQKGKDKAYFTANDYSNKSLRYNRIYSFDLAALSTVKFSEKELAKLIKNEYEELDYSVSYIFQGADKTFVYASDMQQYGLNESAKIYTLEAKKLELHCDDEEVLWNSMGSDAVLYGSPTLQIIDGDFYHLYASDTESVLECFDKHGEKVEILRHPARLDGYAFIDGELHLLALSETKLQEIYKLKDGELKQVTKFNEKVLKGHYVAEPQELRLETEAKIAGWVLLPENFDPKKKYPAILDIHGGPRTIYGSCFFHEMQYWVAEGYIVFFCNPRGSDGRGDEFADIRGQYGGIDFEDIMDFTDAVLAKYPQIDSERLGVTGGSYGGFMTNWIIGHTDRFKAAATQRSITNWISFYGTSDISYTFACDQNACDTLSEEGFMKLWEHSPIRYVNNVKTPTLIIHSDADYRCPEEQAFQLFTALLDRGVPSEMYLFKDETHELSRSGKPEGRIERLRQITRWMDKYLKAE